MRYLAISLLALGLHAKWCSWAAEKPRPDVRLTELTEFFPEEIDPGLEWLRCYSTYPAKAKTLDDVVVKQVIAEGMVGAGKELIKQSIFPDMNFILEHMWLVPAKEFPAPHNKEDIAFVRYRIGDHDCLIAMNDNLFFRSTRLLLFVRDPKLNAPAIPGGVDPFSDLGQKMLLNRRKERQQKMVKLSEVAMEENLVEGVIWMRVEGGGCLIVNLSINQHAIASPWTPGDESWFGRIKRFHDMKAERDRKRP